MPPDREGKKVHQKDALVQTVSLLQVSWDIFEAQWKFRNEILHAKDRKTTKKKTTRLLEFESKKRNMLRCVDVIIG